LKSETFAKCSITLKFKKAKILIPPRRKIYGRFRRLNFESDTEIGRKEVFVKVSAHGSCHTVDLYDIKKRMTLASHNDGGRVAFDAPQRVLDAHSDHFLVLDFDHLFVSASLHEEIWLLKGEDDPLLRDRVLADAAAFFPEANNNPNGEFARYSGGQRAAVALLLIMALVVDNHRHGLKILLRNVLESLSTANRAAMLGKLHNLHRSHGLELYLLKGDAVQPVAAP